MITDRNHLFQLYRRALLRDPQLRQQTPTTPGMRPAAVLVPVVERANGLHILFIERADHLKHHAGQVAFPGGALEQNDASLLSCALRESEEEIGLRPNQVDILGPLPARVTSVSGFFIQPFLGLVQNSRHLRLDQNEVSAVFEAPLNFVLDPARHDLQTMHWQGQDRRFYQIQYEQHRIWGATAGMLVSLAHVLMPQKPAPRDLT